MSDRVRYQAAGLGLLTIAIVVVAAMFGAIDLRDQDEVDALTISGAVYATLPPVTQIAAGSTTAPTAPPAVSPPSTSDALQRALEVVPVDPAAPARRGTPVQITDTLPPAAPVAGDCESWRPLLERYGIPYDEARPVMWRESRCSNAHNGNGGTRDDSFGPLQVNRYGRLAAWWDEGGYTAAVMATPDGAVAAAAVLYHSCGWSPWRKPYGCDGDYLTTPTPAWGEW